MWHVGGRLAPQNLVEAALTQQALHSTAIAPRLQGSSTLVSQFWLMRSLPVSQSASLLGSTVTVHVGSQVMPAVLRR